MHVLNKKINHNNIRLWNVVAYINNLEKNISQHIMLLLAHLLTGLISLHPLCTWQARMHYFKGFSLICNDVYKQYENDIWNAT